MVGGASALDLSRATKVAPMDHREGGALGHVSTTTAFEGVLQTNFIGREMHRFCCNHQREGGAPYKRREP